MQLLRGFLTAGLVASVATLPAPAHAAQFLYQLTGNDTISFTIDTDALVFDAQPDGFIFRSVNVTVNSVVQIADIGFVYEYSDGGLVIFGTPYDLAGPTLFTGPNGAPNLLSGNFDLVGYTDDSLKFSLTATDLGAAVPEPEAWLMILTGFFLLAGQLRRRRAIASKPITS